MHKWLIPLLFIPNIAMAHDWYDPACCSNRDCAPAEKVIILEDGRMQITTTHGTTIIPNEMIRRESKDHQVHACMRSMTMYGGGKNNMLPICVYMPPGM